MNNFSIETLNGEVFTISSSAAKLALAIQESKKSKISIKEENHWVVQKLVSYLIHEDGMDRQPAFDGPLYQNNLDNVIEMHARPSKQDTKTEVAWYTSFLNDFTGDKIKDLVSLWNLAKVWKIIGLQQLCSFHLSRLIISKSISEARETFAISESNIQSNSISLADTSNIPLWIDL